MFLHNQTAELVQEYAKSLSLLGRYSKLFSESTAPYLSPRVAERLFCHIFTAKDVSRDDSSFDAIYSSQGIGIKTFLESGQYKLEKIAEFNKDTEELNTLHGLAKAKKLGYLRNKRLELSSKLYSVNEAIYHCITRRSSEISVIELPMDNVDIENISITGDTRSTLTFNDGNNDYSFSKSKNTLYMRFKLTDPIFTVKVELLPSFQTILIQLSELVGSTKEDVMMTEFSDETQKCDLPYVILPLYSTSGQRKIVHEKSGLNQWNASGRLRHPDEVYIPISTLIHNMFPGFFPPRDRSFSLILPNGTVLSAKVCQQGSKALMSNPNRDLGKWILRDVLGISEGELVTYSLLEMYGIDSIKISKKSEEVYLLDFSEINSYEDFINQKYLETH